MKFVLRYKKDLFAVAIYLLLTVIYFHQPLFHPGTVLYPAPDMVTEHTWWRHFLIDTIRQTHAIPLWYTYEFSGNIFQANPSTSIFYPINLLFFFITPEYGLTYDFFLDIFLMGLFTYFFVKLISNDRSASFLSGVVAMLGGTGIARIYEGHVANFDNIIWLPLILYFFEQQLRTGKVKYAMLNGITVALCILAGAPQLTAYVLFSSGLYVLLRMVFGYFGKENQEIQKQLLLTTLAYFLGFGLTAIQLLPTFEFAQYSVRTPKNYAFASSISLKPLHTIAFFYPHFFGSLLQNGRMWGLFSFPEFSTYCGVTACLLALASTVVRKNIYVWIFVILLFFSYLYSLGGYGPILPLFYHLPLFGSFRIPASFLFLFAFSMSVLAGLGFKNICEFVASKNSIVLIMLNRIYAAVVGISLCVFLFFSNTSTFVIQAYYKYFNTHYASKNILDQHIRNSYGWIVSDTLTFFLFATAFYIVVLLFQKKKITQRFFTICIVLLVTVDLFYFDLPYLMTRPYNDVYKTTVSKKLYNFVGNNRVLDTDIGVDVGPNKLDNINGYNPAYLKYYRDYFRSAGEYSKDPLTARDPFVTLQKITNLEPLRLLNLKYILAKDKKNFDLFVPQNLPNTTIKRVDGYYVLELATTQPKVYVVPNAKVIPNFDQQLKIIGNKDFDPNMTVLLDKNPQEPLINPLAKTIITYYKKLPNTISMQVITSQPEYVVTSEIWYPGWNVRVDNKPTLLLKANGIFRAVYVQKGVHEIKFSFEPLSFTIGLIISVICVSVLTITSLLFFLTHKRNKH